MKLILSIKPKFCEEIFAGRKNYEYRRKIFKKDVESVLVYATSPICMIVGEFKISQVLSDTPKALWKQTNEYAGITEDFYYRYFHDQDTAYALQISDRKRYRLPINPKEYDAKFVAPQSYRYLE